MAKKNSGNNMWIAGAILGAVAGAAYALWKTPMSGQELRGKLSGGPVAQRDDVQTDRVYVPNASDKLLSKVEHTLAPVVGVELGKTANGTTTEPIAAVKPAPAHKPVAPMTFEVNEPSTPSSQADEPVHPTPPVEEHSATEVAPVETPQNFGADSIRAKRFAWGSPTPEAGLDPLPVEPIVDDIAPEPEPVPEPVAVATGGKTATTSGSASDTSDKIRGQRFAWGDPAPESATQQTNTSTQTQPAANVGAESGNEGASPNRPLERATAAAPEPGSNMRQFPKLGGLEDN